MSIHTITTVAKFKPDDTFEFAIWKFNRVLDVLYEYAKSHKLKLIHESSNQDDNKLNIYDRILADFCNNTPHRHVWTLNLPKTGLSIILLKAEGKAHGANSFVNSYVYYKINPARVMGESFVYTFKAHMTAGVLNKANTLISNISHLLPKLQDSKLQRVDFCRNIKLDTAREVECYILAAKRSFLPSGFHIKPLRYKDGSEYFPDNSVTFIRGHTSIVVYDKYSQMKSKPHYFTEDETAQAYGVLRVEVQIEKTKLLYLRRKNGIADTVEFLTKSDELATELFSHHLFKLFLHGDYYSYEMAIEKAKNSGYKSKAVNDMLLIIKCVSDYKSVDGGLNFLYCNGYKWDRLMRLLNKFNELGLNPCTLPRRWGCERLPNLAKLVNLGADMD